MAGSRNTIEYLYGLTPDVIKPGLERIERLLEHLKNPHLNYPSIIVGGTNGKGSASAMLASILKEAGLKTGLYTSPHLLRFNERIRVNGKEIRSFDVERLVRKMKRVVKKADALSSPSFFEFTTAMAFEYFREKKVDVAVLEVGMGGRLDATNVVIPLVSIITSVGFDHTQYLGAAIEDIAFEKAGIIKEGIRVVSAVSDGAASGVIKKISKGRGSGLCVFGRDFSAMETWSGFDYKGDIVINGLETNLKGAHQIRNAACAIKATEVLRSFGYDIRDNAIRRGLKNAVWPGRLEVVSKKPVLVLDCAHNPDGARALAIALRDFKYKRLVFVMGIMADKDIKGIFNELLPMADIVIFTEPKNKRRADVKVLSGIAKPYKCRVAEIKDVARAIDYAVKEAGPLGLVCVTGSVFTVAEAKMRRQRR